MENTESIITIKGIGEKKIKLFNKLGIHTVSELIEFYPRDYKDRTKITKISDAKEQETCTLLCRVKETPENIRIKSLAVTRVKIYDDTGALDAIWFNMPYLKSTLTAGAYYFFSGKIGKRFSRLAIISPEFEMLEKEDSLSHNRIVPVYRSTKGLTQKAILKSISEALKVCGNIDETLPQEILRENGLCGKSFAVHNIHFPESNDAFLKARERLCFDEFFILQTALYKFKHKHINDTRGFILDASLDYGKVIYNLPFMLTEAQQNVLLEIKSDMSSGAAMNRLIQGDVGSGKTAVALCACYWAIQNGYQAALMAPTEVLAQQHYESATQMLEPYGVETVLLNGAMPKKQKDAILSNICSGKAQMIIGTHAVIQKAVIFNRLGLVITDEQHRFGVNQRGALTSKGESPHCIVMTATPIPRTLALILYGDLDISVIDTLPPGRQEIVTSVVNDTYRSRIYSFIEEHVSNGRQAYIICPAIENKDGNENRAELLYLQEHIESLKKVFLRYRVEALHGKMKPAEKQSIMERFAANEINILVSTTVIEVGINVPNATVMTVENAERFGLSQLHQLRGRVGRGSEKSYCILISNSESDVAKERLKAMKDTSDGFIISELDLKLRGSGDFFGTRQHGLPEMKIANLFKDLDILKKAEKSAESLVSHDPLLESEDNAPIALLVDKLFKGIRFGVNL